MLLYFYWFKGDATWIPFTQNTTCTTTALTFIHLPDICYVSRKNIGYYSNRHCCNRSFFSLSSGLRRVVLLFSLNRLLIFLIGELQNIQDLSACLTIKISGRLNCKNKCRLVYKCPSYGYSLLLTSWHLSWQMFFPFLKTQHIHNLT